MTPQAGWRDGRHLLRIALVLGLVVRAAVLLETRTLGTGIVDEQHYSRIAANILEGNGFAAGPGQPTSIRPPLYPALVAAIWHVTGLNNLQAVRFVQILLTLLATAFVYELGRRSFNEVVGRYAAAIFWLYPSFIFFNFLILTETIFTLLLVAFVLLTVMLVQRPTIGIALGCGVSLGLAALARSVVWPLPLVLCPLLMWLIRAPVKTKLVLAVLVLAGYAIPVLPWAIRNTKLQGVVEVVDTMGGMNLRMGNYEYTPDDRMWDAVSLTGERSWVYGIDKDVDHAPTEGEKDKWAQRKAIAYMRAHPGITLRRSLIKFSDFWGLEREYPAGVQQGLFSAPRWLAALISLVIVAGYVAVILPGAAGLWLTPPAWRVHLVMLLPVAAITGAHTIVFGHSRYHLPLIPILAVYAAALLTLRDRIAWNRHRLASAGAAATIVLLIGIWIREVMLVDPARIQAFLKRVL